MSVQWRLRRAGWRRDAQYNLRRRPVEPHHEVQASPRRQQGDRTPPPGGEEEDRQTGEAT